MGFGARCAPYDSRRLAARFVICPRGRPWQGKGNAAAYRRLFTPPVASLPQEKAGGRAALKISRTRMRFTTPRHFRTAQRGGYAWGISVAGVAFVAEAIPVSGKGPCQPSAVWIRTKGAFGAPCGTHRPRGISYPLGILDRPMRMVCSGTASGQGSTLAIPSLLHIIGDMGAFKTANPSL